jgi:hypothetical protein
MNASFGLALLKPLNYSFDPLVRVFQLAHHYRSYFFSTNRVPCLLLMDAQTTHHEKFE